MGRTSFTRARLRTATGTTRVASASLGLSATPWIQFSASRETVSLSCNLQVIPAEVITREVLARPRLTHRRHSGSFWTASGQSPCWILVIRTVRVEAKDELARIACAASLGPGRGLLQEDIAAHPAQRTTKLAACCLLAFRHAMVARVPAFDSLR